MKADLQSVRERDGIPEAEQIRRGIRLWLDSQKKKPASRRAATRRKA
jgi:hypothetical protein